MDRRSNARSLPRTRSITLAVFGWFFVVLLGASFGGAAPPASPNQGSTVPSAMAAKAKASLAPSASVPSPVSADAAAAADGGAPPASALTAEFVAQASKIRELVAGKLDVSVDPQSLFDVDLGDETALGLEVERLRLLLGKNASGDAGAPNPDAGRSKARAQARAAADAAAPDAADAGAAAAVVEASWTKEELTARLVLDGARLDFYQLPRAERERLLALHAKRRAESAESRAEKQLGDAERRARQAEKERLDALEAARHARTEALRVVAEEKARLFSVSAEQAQYEKELLGLREQVKRLREAILAWSRRGREMRDAAAAGRVDEAAVNGFYEELRAELRAAREALAEALGALGESHVPNAGEDRLAELPAELDVSEPRRKREQVKKEAARLSQMEDAVQRDIASTRYDEVVALNHERLALYPYLSEDLRSAIAGFGSAGLDQARAEVRQVVVVLRYHLSETLHFVASLRAPGGARGESALTAALIALKWLLPIGVFVWWRRRGRADAVLGALQEAAKQERRRARSVGPSRLERGARLLERVHRPLEWLLLLLAVVWLLPSEARGLLEVQLVSIVFGWVFGGAAVVAAIDAVAGEAGDRRLRESRLQTAQLRFRSLRLVGRVVVVVGLILALSDRLVGKGTIYTWVISTCWFAALPVAFVIVRWWREVIFERLGLRRKKNRFDVWALGRQQGWQSVPAALAAGAYLLANGALRGARQEIGRFDLTRRALAYLFRRDMSRRSAQKQELLRLAPDVFLALGPSTPSKSIVPSVADAQVDAVIERINAVGGGVFALVGERGAGKSTLLRRILTKAHDVVLVECPIGGTRDFEEKLAVAVGEKAGATLEESAKLMDRPDRDSGLLVDDAHRLIHPSIGGLADFDRVLDVARSHSKSCSWVFAFDEVLWRFLERARGARPLFDEVIPIQPWREEGIASLLTARAREAGITPKFDALLQDLPPDADEIDVREALERTAAAYYRLIWDYAAGNPGVALHAFRACLGRDEAGEVGVKVFRSPDTEELEKLPDSAVFVLRAVVQLEQARPEDIVRATMLSPAEVANAVRFGLVRGYFLERSARYVVAWAWFRPLTRFLQRRRLLFRD